MADYGGRRGRGPPGYGGGGRGAGRGDFAPRGGRGGDFGGRGDFRGGRGGGRDFGGRGGGGGRFGGGGGGGGRGLQQPTNRESVVQAYATVRMPSQNEAQLITQQIEASLPERAKALANMERPRRPGFNEKGFPIRVLGNYFGVQLRLMEAHHYDVAIVGLKAGLGGELFEAAAAPRPGQPERLLPTPVCKLVVAQLAKDQQWRPGQWAFDGRKNIYSPDQFLPKEERSYQVKVPEEGDEEGGGDGPTRWRHFLVKIKWASSVNITDIQQYLKGGSNEMPQDSIQALDVALKHPAMMSPLLVPVARAFYNPRTARSLYGGAEVWLGYQQSLRPCQTGLLLNMDIAATAFIEPMDVIPYILNAVGRGASIDRLNPMQLKKAARAIKGVQVEVTHLGKKKRKYRVKGLEQAANRLMFRNEQENRDMSVAEYFEATYHIKLKQPGAPCLSVGSSNKPVWLPAEVCRIRPGQRKLKLDDKQTAEMIKTAAAKPEQRVAAIMGSMRESGVLSDPTPPGFGMQIQNQMLQINARVLPHPKLVYQKVVDPGPSGAWNLSQVGRYLIPATVHSWAVAAFADPNYGDLDIPENPGSLHSFLHDLVNECRKMGMQPPRDMPPIVWHQGMSSFVGETLQKAVDAAKNVFSKPPTILLVLLPDTGAELYKEVKRATDSMLGVPSQCFVANKAGIQAGPPRKPRVQYCAKCDRVRRIGSPWL